MILKQLLALFLGAQLLILPAGGADLDLTSVEKNDALENMMEDNVFGINIEELQYVVSIENGIIKKIELNSTDRANFHINLTKKEAWQLLQEYDDMSNLARINFISTRSNLSIKDIFDLMEGIKI